MNGLNDSHRRRLASILIDIEENLANIERAAFTESTSPFSQVSPDLAPTQRQVLGDYLHRIREVIERLGPQLGQWGSTKKVPASWAIRTALHFVDIAIAEMGASYLRGYGFPEESATAALEQVQADLRRPVSQLGAYLEQDLGRDPAARLARLQSAPIDLELVKTLELIIREHGLVELRPSFESLLQQLESDELEIAVFGRISSGKSSLLNAVLGKELLPVGVVPVTAVPTRIRFGAAELARIAFAERPEEIIELPRLAEFVSEAGNPDNARRVTRVVVEAPLTRLRGAVAFVDTPGIGSLANAGDRQTRHYLPRCDLGVLLVSGVPAPQDLELLRLLYESGIPALVALSKADLLAPLERREMKAHVQSEIRRALSLDLEVGVVGREPELLNSWFDREIMPRLERAQELREESTRRKLASLRESAAAILRVQLNGAKSAPGDEIKSLDEQAQTALRGAVKSIASLAASSEAFADLLVHKAAQVISNDPARQPEEVILTLFVDDLGRARRETERIIVGARDRLRELLTQMGSLAGATVSPEDLQLDLLELPATQPRIPAFEVGGLGLFKSRLEQRLRSATGESIRAEFRKRAEELAGWAQRQAAHVDRQFSSQSGPILARSSASASTSRHSEIEDALRSLS